MSDGKRKSQSSINSDDEEKRFRCAKSETSSSSSNEDEKLNETLNSESKKSGQGATAETTATGSGDPSANEPWVSMLQELNLYLDDHNIQNRKPLKRSFNAISKSASGKTEAANSDEESEPPTKLFLESVFTTSLPLTPVVSSEDSSASVENNSTSSDFTSESKGGLSTLISQIEVTDVSQASDSDQLQLETNVDDHSVSCDTSKPENRKVADLTSEPPGQKGIKAQNTDDESSTSPIAADEDREIEEFYDRDFYELNGVRMRRLPGTEQIQNIFPLVEYLLKDLIELRTFLDGRQVALNTEPIAGPSSGPTAYDRQMATISDEFGTGVESITALTTRAVVAEWDMRVVSPDRNPSVESSTSAGLLDSEAADYEEKETRKEQSSPEHESNPEVSTDSFESAPASVSPKLDPEIDQLKSATEISSMLYVYNAEARQCLNHCIQTTRNVLNFCLLKRPDQLHGELENHISNVLDMLRRLVTLRQECSSLLKKCLNRNDVAGVTYILKVKTHIAKAYNELLEDIIQLNYHFREIVDNNIPESLDDPEEVKN